MIVAGLAAFLPATPGVLGAFWPAQDEPDLAPLLRRLGTAGWAIALPCFGKGDATFVLRAWEPAAELITGPLGVRMPHAAQPLCSVETLTHLLVPGLAFDRGGSRLGRGGGMYDRFLATSGSAVRIGVCFACQIVDRVPCAPHDVRMHVVADETGVRPAVPSASLPPA